MAVTHTSVRIEKDGQLTIPLEVRQHLGLEEGDVVVVTETPDGLLITPAVVVAMQALDQMGDALREAGVTLEEWIESGREIRGELLREMYGIEPTDEHS